MADSPKSNIETIKQANREMLDYFNDSYISKLEQIQELKTECFELDVKTDELLKTRDIYSFKSNTRKSVFTPVNDNSMINERNVIIDEQIKDIKGVRDSIYDNIRKLEKELISLKKRLAILNDANDAINTLCEIEETAATKDPSEDEDGFVFVEQQADKSTSTHGYNILMQDAFDKTFLSTLIEHNIKDNLVNNNHKLEMLSYLLSSDISRAKLTLQEIILSSKDLVVYVDDISSKLNCNIDSNRPIWNLLDDFVMNIRESHPECVLNADIECNDYELNLHPVFTINLLKLLNFFFDNIFMHSNANRIEFQLSLSKNVVDACISDNGVGITKDYLEKAPWYTSLHKAHEIIYLLNGKLNITGDILSGTTVRFSFPVQE